MSCRIERLIQTLAITIAFATFASAAHAQWSEYGDDIVYSDGNVGIGPVPSYPLHVNDSDHLITALVASYRNGATAIKGKAAGLDGGGIGVHGYGLGDYSEGVFAEVNGDNSFGLRAEATGSSAVGVLGVSMDWIAWNNNIGVKGVVDGLDAIGVYGVNHSDDGDAYGVYGDSYSPEGYGTVGHARSTTGANFGVFGRSDSNAGFGVYGWVPSGTGNTAGVFGDSDSWSGRGVQGRANHPSGVNYGVYGESASPTGYGVFGVSPWTGLNGLATGPNGRAVFGSAALSTAYAGYFDGQVAVDGHVGIGRDTPFNSNTMLSIWSDTNNWAGSYIETTGASGRPFYGYSAGGNIDAYHYFDGQTNQWRLYAGGERVTVSASTGNVGVGTTNPAFLMHVNGSAGKPGGGSWSVASDRRLKKDIRPLDRSLDRLLSLRGVSFEYRDAAAINELSGRQTGFIAQEVEQVFPDWVEEGDDSYKRLSIRGFEAEAVEAMRELRAEKDAEIAALEARVAQLEQLVEAALVSRNQ
ncbi:MAG: tail fiber domain-containing protein [Phycisphaerales bacterium]